MTIIEDLLTKGGRRTHAAVVLMAAAALSVAVVVLAIAAHRGRSVAGEMSTVCLALGGLTGWAYNVGKKTDAAGAQ